ncbi:DgyrCDS8761 [Dimorphilus gyrociliatus]|uniref:DgyrCDS8761 n=1 Tax=Dimorphilus gyrociliatus TaxID=2664684 RepID=A0A7I8VXB7_9ANNE|nr:DgyrCDS8761 [Dimorphilus gyrociliatus]
MINLAVVCLYGIFHLSYCNLIDGGNNQNSYKAEPNLYCYDNSSKYYSVGGISWSNNHYYTKGRSCPFTLCLDNGIHFISLNFGISLRNSGEIHIPFSCSNGKDSSNKIEKINYKYIDKSDLSAININFLIASEQAHYCQIDVKFMNLYSDNLCKMTSISSFSYQSPVYGLIQMKHSESAEKMTFTVLKSSTIGVWDSNIRIVEDGIYLLTVSAFSQWYTKFLLTVNSSNGDVYTLRNNYRDSPSNLISMSYLLKCKIKETLSFNLLEGQLQQTSSLSILKLSVSKTRPGLYVSSSSHKSNVQQEKEISFDVTHISIGNSWNNNTFTYTIDIPGRYYVYVTIESREGSKVDVAVQKNGKTIFEILKYSAKTHDGHVLANSAIVKFSQGDSLRIISNAMSSYGALNKSTTLLVIFLS